MSPHIHDVQGMLEDQCVQFLSDDDLGVVLSLCILIEGIYIYESIYKKNWYLHSEVNYTRFGKERQTEKGIIRVRKLSRFSTNQTLLLVLFTNKH